MVFRKGKGYANQVQVDQVEQGGRPPPPPETATAEESGKGKDVCPFFLGLMVILGRQYSLLI